jgi:hypothetical protein
MDPVLLARLSALGRLGFGVGLMRRPTLLTAPWIGLVAFRPGPKVLARALGARDLVLGAGTLASSGREQQKWLLAALVADATDLAATVTERRLARASRVSVALVAGAGVAMGLGALAGTRRPATAATPFPPGPRRP